MKKKNIISLAVCSICLVSSVAFADQTTASQVVTKSTAGSGSNVPTATEIVFLQRSGEALLQQNGNTYTLTLKHVAQNVEMIPTSIRSAQLKHGFADYIKTVPVTNYLSQAWSQSNGSFTNNNPNATLVGEYNQQTQTIMGTLSNPQYNVKKSSMTYTFSLLGNANSVSSLVGKKLDNTSLFIDGACGGSALCSMWICFTDCPTL